MYIRDGHTANAEMFYLHCRNGKTNSGRAIDRVMSAALLRHNVMSSVHLLSQM